MMEMVKVDPKLFVTCRLCLEEQGMYQITPVVQHQIKYCFDIDVDQFDGLPQLICKECENILSEYFTKKRIFVGRQNALKAKLQVRKEVEDNLCPSPPPAVSSSQQNDNEETIARPKPMSKAKKRKSRIISSSSSSSSSLPPSPLPSLSVPVSRETSCSRSESRNTDNNTTNKKSQNKNRPKKRRESWEANYTRKYGCKLCNKHIKFGGGVKNHIRTHNNLLSKYQDIINRTYTVKLNKIDDKLNPTGSTDTVALTQYKILGQQKENVYVLYTLDEDNNAGENIASEQRKSEVTYIESDNNEDGFLNKSKQVKRRRVSSRSSTDTVILNDGDKIPPLNVGKHEKRDTLQNNKLPEDAEIECIDLDDSSNDSTQNDHVKEDNDDDTNPVTPKDVEAIKSLIRVCHNKYVAKRQESLETEIKQAATKGPQLKRKFLSMGRKVINKQGFNCTGLLRFIESRNLEIKWIPTMIRDKESNYVRIMPREKSKEELLPDNFGWKKKNAEEVPEGGRVKILTNTNVGEQNANKSVLKSILTTSSPTSITSAPNGKSLPDLNVTITKNSNIDINSTSATIVERGNASDDETSLLFKDWDRKLLNSHPVANPKQLPKKCNNSDLKLQQATVEKMVENVVPEYLQYIDVDDDQPSSNNTEMPMPIISSTVSLAGSSAGDMKIKTEENDNTDTVPTVNSETTNEVDKPAPRIKVKPVSELMSERVLKTLGHSNASDNFLTGNNTPAIPTTNGLGLVITQVTSGGVPVNPNQLNPNPPATNSGGIPKVRNSREYIILDTVELPNTKTDSPVQYLRNLLHFHNIDLVPYDSMPPNAVCLIKFKLQFLPNSSNPSLTLCLSVHCAGNKFALGVRPDNPTQVNYIDLNTIGATWQWEILKNYTIKQDVINRMLQNAEKVSQEVYQHTQRFFASLKSINVKRDEVC